MMGLLPLWVMLTWMVFPVLALVAESASVGGVEGMAKLHPWPATDTVSAAAGCSNGDSSCSTRERCVLESV